VPAFYAFAEWLKQPQTLPGTMLTPTVIGTNTTYGTYGTNVTLPRGLALIWSLDQMKLAYKAGTATSNDVATALSAFTAATSQAQGWLTTVTNMAVK
jgi:hypothetical protein